MRDGIARFMLPISLPFVSCRKVYKRWPPVEDTYLRLKKEITRSTTKTYTNSHQRETLWRKISERGMCICIFLIVLRAISGNHTKYY